MGERWASDFCKYIKQLYTEGDVISSKGPGMYERRWERREGGIVEKSLFLTMFLQPETLQLFSAD